MNVSEEEKDRYASQKKYLSTRKALRVWVDPDKYERFKAAAEANGTSVYALVNGFLDEYLEKNGG